jgi:signal transduction histidine kinase/DNA-binding response OmpR family regulator
MLPRQNYAESKDADLQQEHSLPADSESHAQVLIVEDNPYMSRMITAILSKLYRISTAYDGQDGFEQALALHPDLILCDVSMPRMSGEELVRALRTRSDFDDIPIVVLSGHTDEQLRVQLLRAGAQDYLMKPFNREELRVRVDNLLMMRQARQMLQGEVAVQSRDLVTLAGKITEQQRQLKQALSLLQERETRLVAQSKELEERGRQLERTNEALTIRNHQLNHMQSRLRAIIDASQEAMLFLAPDGIPIEVNTRFTSLFGGDPTSLLSLAPDQLMALLKTQFADDASLDEALAWSTTDQENIFRALQVQIEPARREFELFSPPVINVDQTYIGRLYVWHDVTREREVDRIKSEFVSMASHELRTPLTSIKGYIDLILNYETVGKLSKMQREFLGIVQSNTRRLMKITDDLLDLSRLESGKRDLDVEALNINLLISELLPSFNPSWESKRQTFKFHLPEEVTQVLGDANLVTQILSNLLSNAHKYTPEEGHIELSVETIGSIAWISIIDSGIGLSNQEQDQLFTPFYRARNALTEAGGGTGLGLVITRSLVEMQGGEIQVTSEPNHGSTFRFNLPLA